MKTQTKSSRSYYPQAAVRYARVLYELNIQEEAVQKTREIYIQVPQLQDVFANPTIPEEQKENVIDEVFPDAVKNFLKIVCRHRKMNLMEDIFAAYDKYCSQQNKILQAVLTCVEPPDEAQLKEMQTFLCKKYKVNQANIEIQTDQTLIGGFLLHVGNDEYDWSLKGRLNRLNQKLTWR